MKIDASEFRKLAPARQIQQLRGQKLDRLFQVERDGLNEDKRTVWLSIASELPYERWWGVEILDCRTNSIRDARLKAGAPLLVGHDTADQVGVVDHYEITPNRKLRVLARFGRSARAEEIWRDVLDGIRRNTSVGYIIHDLKLEKSEEGVNTYRVTDWEPMEGSLVSVPADFTVGVGRSVHPTHPKGVTVEPEELHQQQEAGTQRERDRVTMLMAAGEQYREQGGLDVASTLIKDPNGSVEQFRQRMLARIATKKPAPSAEPFEAPYQFDQGAREILPTPRYFAGERAQERAYRSGMWLRAMFGNEGAKRWCADAGLQVRTMSGEVLSQGGALVPGELSSTIIDLANTYGVFRRESNFWPMGTDTLTVPKSTSDPSAAFISESGSVSGTDGGWGTVNFTAKKIGTLVKIPTELMEDSIIDVADRVAFQISRAFSKTEDQCGFIGDASSTYGGMRGITNLLIDGNHDAGKVVAVDAAHDQFGEIDATDLGHVVAALPEYAHEGAKWYCSQVAWAKVFFRLLMAAGGNTGKDLGGDMPKSYGGYPVVLSSVLPAGATTDYSGQVMLAFGNLRQSSSTGVRRDIRINVLTELFAGNDQVGILATERFHIINHDLGDNTTAGPMVGLVGGAS